MAKYDLTNAKPFKELTPSESDNIVYEQGYHDAIANAKAWLKARNVLTEASLEGFEKAMEE